MSRFGDRLTRGFDEIAERATPSASAHADFRARVAQHTPHEEVVIMMTPDTIQPRRPRWVVPATLVAAAALVLALAGVVALRSGGGDLATTTDTLPAASTSTPAPAASTAPMAPVTGRSELVCPPLVDSGWQRSEALRDLSDLTGLAVNDEWVVAVGTGRNSGPAAYRSSDAVRWEEAEGPPVDPDFMAGGTQGFVAVSTEYVDGRPNAPVVAFSLDGSSWERLDPEALPESRIAFLTGVSAGPRGFVIVGKLSGDFSLLMWSSADGRTWSETDLPHLSQGVEATVAATESGWVAVTASGPPDAQTQVKVWTSSDGIRWRETATRSAPSVDALWGHWGVTRVTPLLIRDGTWVLADPGESDVDPGTKYPTVWVSTDDGATWNEHVVLFDGDATEFAVYDATSTEFGFVLAGEQGALDGGFPGAFLHWSADGTSWKPCYTHPLGLWHVVGFDEGLVALDHEFGDVYIWNEP